MVLNYIWIAFFVLAFIVATIRLVFFGDAEVFPDIINSTFASSKSAFEISLGLTGVLALWMGIMRIGEQGGVIALFSRVLSPLFSKLFPDIPKGHPVTGSIFMNMAANMLGLDNAATPLGLKAMEGLQELNPKKDTATNPMIMFLVINTSGLTLIPISIMVYRAQLGAAQPTDVFVPILIATFISTLAGIIAVALYQRINLLNRTILLFLGGAIAFITGIIWFFSTLSQDQIDLYSTTFANVFLFVIIIGFILAGIRKKVNVYDAFIEGAKEGFTTAVRIIPYLVAILVAIGVFRASGCMDYLTQGIASLVEMCGLDSDFVGALPTALMKPLSGSGARGLMVDAMSTYGADSFVGRLACIFQGSTDTTFYILAVYFGSVGVAKTRHAVPCGLLADFAGILAAIFVCYLFF
ncbi:MAG TPA: spore maturation protein [Candidatus Phocaeicola caecigallinarum]|jgi:spore maturation protein SpmA|uniref:nucleoside recognition domain-containing protein n=1 Tax=Bacteroidaceae TaxID=815 RepID=UPI00195A8F9A|nr:spore maturation protein [Bacteroides gallinaceum]MBM6657333.1 spore maturation protein [Bacteroides gallinaceum]HJD11254.1 spore maturation protein [Candidatus Phocaeicola caecigallinarum]